MRIRLEGMRNEYKIEKKRLTQQFYGEEQLVSRQDQLVAIDVAL